MLNYLIQNYGYDSGHMLIGILLGLIIYNLGAPLIVAAALGGLLYAVPKEIYDMVKDKHCSIDNLADLVSYQVSWPLVYGAGKEPVLALIMLTVVGVVYLTLVKIKLKV